MDEMMILIFLGFVLVGVLIGYPLGQVFGQRATSGDNGKRRRQAKRRDILSAEVIE